MMKISYKPWVVALLVMVGMFAVALQTKAACNAADGTQVMLEIDGPAYVGVGSTNTYTITFSPDTVDTTNGSCDWSFSANFTAVGATDDESISLVASTNASSSIRAETISCDFSKTGWASSGVIGCEDDIKVTVVKVELKVTHPDIVGSTGSDAKYSNSPETGSADNLFSTWVGENFRVICNIEPVALKLLLPDNFIKWTVQGKTIPDNTTVATLFWLSEGRKEIKINLLELGFVKKAHVDIPDVGSISEAGAAAAITALVGVIPSTKIVAYGLEARTYGDTNYTVGHADWDAVRHALWMAYSVSDLLVTRGQALLVSTGHEYDNRAEQQQAFNSTMDLNNNYVGAYMNNSTPLGTPDYLAIHSDFDATYAAGGFWIWAGEGSQSSSEGILVNSDGTKIITE